MKGSRKVSFPMFYLYYKQATVIRVLDIGTYAFYFSTKLPCLLRHFHSGRPNSKSLGGKMMPPAGRYQGKVAARRNRLLSQGVLLHDSARPLIAGTVNLLNTRH
jgi:hypothetical protein